ncbi:MAG TPA: type II toxin-antitoxin system RelE/ParE family toxin [Beijerinckiaceae bacterium]|nr:type II toxin-antitoxin system RelE/ParE family toxin [Beijerinckiaceae bacterium]
MRVVWTRGAGSQLRAAYRYLAQENRQAAAAFLNAVEKLEANLARFPGSVSRALTAFAHFRSRAIDIGSFIVSTRTQFASFASAIPRAGR